MACQGAQEVEEPSEWRTDEKGLITEQNKGCKRTRFLLLKAILVAWRGLIYREGRAEGHYQHVETWI